jgi:hypothetical protein
VLCPGWDIVSLPTQPRHKGSLSIFLCFVQCLVKKKKPGKEGEGKDKGRKQTREVIHELGEKRPQ